jgi:outer membrane protein TolC
LNRGRHDAEIAEAQANLSADRAEYDNQRALVFEEIQEALIRAQSAKRLVDLYSQTLRPQAQATLKSTVAAYQADRTDFLNLLDSQNTTLEVELDYYRAASELESRIADLERAVGAPLTRDGHESDTPVPQASCFKSLGGAAMTRNERKSSAQDSPRTSVGLRRYGAIRLATRA